MTQLSEYHQVDQCVQVSNEMKLTMLVPFPKEYEIEALDEMPSSRGNTKCYYYPGAKEDGGSDGVALWITPSDRSTPPWIGIFAFGPGGSKGVTGAFSCPDENALCVVSKGRGYVIDSRIPTRVFEVPALPVVGVLPVTTHDILLFNDFTKLVAWGRGGLLWKSERLSWDGLQIDRVESDYLCGRGWSPASSGTISFRLDLRTGHKSPE